MVEIHVAVEVDVRGRERAPAADAVGHSAGVRDRDEHAVAGALPEFVGIRAAAGGAVLLMPLVRDARLSAAEGLDLSPSMHWPEPVLTPGRVPASLGKSKSTGWAPMS